jgi:hypothetical protein
MLTVTAINEKITITEYYNIRNCEVAKTYCFSCDSDERMNIYNIIKGKHIIFDIEISIYGIPLRFKFTIDDNVYIYGSNDSTKLEYYHVVPLYGTNNDFLELARGIFILYCSVN